MRFLCLHGMGTNSAIYEAQLAPIRAQLDPTHEFIFLDGTIPCPPADAVDGIFPGPYYCYYSKPVAVQLQAAYDLIYEAIEEDGPFDGVFGFSQGGALAASMMLHHREMKPHEEDLFKVLVFTCASLPFNLNSELQNDKYYTWINPQTGAVDVRDLKPGEVVETSKINGYIVEAEPGELPLRRYHASREKNRITIPTAHIMGRLDPFVPQSYALADLCGDDKVVVVHELGHKLPRDLVFARKAAMAISNTISKALFRT